MWIFCHYTKQLLTKERTCSLTVLWPPIYTHEDPGDNKSEKFTALSSGYHMSYNSDTWLNEQTGYPGYTHTTPDCSHSFYKYQLQWSPRLLPGTYEM